MPMRKGGKYKDLVRRAKGESTLAQEALARAKRIQEEYVKQQLEKRQRELLAGAALKNHQAQLAAQRKQRILNILLGGKKGNAKKFFKAWIKGVEVMKTERKNRERDAAWRRSTPQVLQDPVFRMPFETMRLTGQTSFLEHAEGGQRQQANLRAAASMPDLLQSQRPTSSTIAPRRLSVDPSDTPFPFLEGEATAVAHHSSGRKCFVDSMYRMVFAPDLARTLGASGQRTAGNLRSAAASPMALTMGPSTGFGGGNAWRDAPRGRMSATFNV